MGNLQRLLLAGLVGLGLGLAGPSAPAEARTADACQEAWSKAVRSYLTANRKAGPDGKVPADIDEQELVAQAWLAAFRSPCKLEQDGLKAEARLEAAMLGVQILAKLDPKGCGRFMQYYMESTKAKDVCDMSTAGAGTADLRAAIEGSIPAKR